MKKFFVSMCVVVNVVVHSVLFFAGHAAAEGVNAKPGLPQKPAAMEIKVTQDETPLRATADINAATLRVFKKGDSLKAVARQGAYWKVQMDDGSFGYVALTAAKATAGIGQAKDAIHASGQSVNDGKAAAKEGVATAKEGAKEVKKATHAVLKELKGGAQKASEKKNESKPAAKAPEVKGSDLEKAANKIFK